MTHLQLALRRYELDHKTLPDELDDLIPEYLDQVPADPFTDQKIRWNSNNRVLYSTGSDFKDDDGKFEKPNRYRGSGEDIGMFYWWSEKAAQWREEQRIETLPPAPKPSREKKKPGKPSTPPVEAIPATPSAKTVP